MATAKKTVGVEDEKSLIASLLDDHPEELEYVPTGDIGFDMVLSNGKGLPMGSSILLWAEPGCVDKDTEFFTGYGWKKMSEWNNDKVLQYNEDGTASLVNPIAYIKEPCEQMYHIKTKYGLDQMLSEDHNMIYFNNSANPASNKKRMSEVIEEHEKSSQGFRGLIKTSFNYIEGVGVDISDINIKVMLAVLADSYLDRNKCAIRLKKERKIEKLESLLKEANIEYTKNLNNGYTIFRFTPPIYTKEFPKEWYNMSQRQLKVIRDNVSFWDGYHGTSSVFFSVNKNNADFVQFAFASSGVCASILVDEREGRNTCYGVHISNKVYKSFGHVVNQKRNIPLVPTADGMKYCFTVPSGMLVLRRNNNIFITGNCGKTTLFMDAAKRLIASHKAAGKPFRVLYIDVEGGAITLIRDMDMNKYRESQDLLYYRKSITWRQIETICDHILKGEKIFGEIKLIVIDSVGQVQSDQNMQKSIADGDFGTKSKERGNFYSKYFPLLQAKGISTFLVAQARQNQEASGIYDPKTKAAASWGDRHNVDIIIRCSAKQDSTFAAKTEVDSCFETTNKEANSYIMVLDPTAAGCKSREGGTHKTEVLIEKGKGINNFYILLKMLKFHGFLAQSGAWYSFGPELTELLSLKDKKYKKAEVVEVLSNSEDVGKIVAFLKEMGCYSTVKTATTPIGEDDDATEEIEEE